jgi:hypothetical protein
VFAPHQVLEFDEAQQGLRVAVDVGLGAVGAATQTGELDAGRGVHSSTVALIRACVQVRPLPSDHDH